RARQVVFGGLAVVRGERRLSHQQQRFDRVGRDGQRTSRVGPRRRDVAILEIDRSEQERRTGRFRPRELQAQQLAARLGRLAIGNQRARERQPCAERGTGRLRELNRVGGLAGCQL